MKRLKRLGKIFDNVGRNFAKQGGVYGGYFTGQLGKTVVGGTWKDKKTLRTYSVPTNPNTPGQVAQRGKFKISQVVASAMLETIVKPYWNPFTNGQSGFNAFIGYNSQRVTDNQDFVGLFPTKGNYQSLPVGGFTNFNYGNGTGIAQFDWDGDVGVLGDADDVTVLMIIDIRDYDPLDKTPLIVVTVDLSTVRSTETKQITIADSGVTGEIFGYIGFIQPASDPILKVATSVAKAATVT